MNDFGKIFYDGVRQIVPEMRQRISDDYQARISEERNYEREDNIAIATKALLDAGVKENVVEQMLQKHWDLRLSETRPFIEWAKSQLQSKKCVMFDANY